MQPPPSKTVPHGPGTDQVTSDVDALVAALDAAEGRRSSPIYRWLDAHYDELTSKLNGRRIDWEVFAAHLASKKLTDGKGKAATPECVRNTWLRVKAAHNRKPGSAKAGRNSQTAGPLEYVDAEQPNAPQHGISKANAPDTSSASQPDDHPGEGAHQAAVFPAGVRLVAAQVIAKISVTGSPDERSTEQAEPASPRGSTDAPSTFGAVGQSDSAHQQRWTASFTAPPPTPVTKFLRDNSGNFDIERKLWTGLASGDVEAIETTVRTNGGTFGVALDL